MSSPTHSSVTSRPADRVASDPRPPRVWRTLVAWLDSAAVVDDPADPRRDRIDWQRIVPFALLHVGCLAVLWTGVGWFALAVCAALYLARMFAITAFYHRYFSHRTFRTSRPLQFLFALLGSAAAQRGPLWWAAHHRKHHKHSDTERDAHSPRQKGLLWSHMLWFTTRRNFVTDLAQVPDFARYPELRFLDRFDVLAPTVLAGLLFATGEILSAVAPALHTSGWQLLAWGFFVSTALLFHGTSTINSLGHVLGRRRFETGDDSRNSLLLALITLGEGWHNNHHFYPVSARQGFHWWEIDVCYYALRALAWSGLIWDLRPVPAHVLAGRRTPERA